jgi:hypothetical protein
MKMKATIEVEFEANEDQDENVLRAALIPWRIRSRAILEYGTGRASIVVHALGLTDHTKPDVFARFNG